MRALREDFCDYVDDQESDRAEGDSTVRRLNEYPVAGVEYDAVGGDQAKTHRGAQRDEREDAGIVQHKVLRSRVDHMTNAGQRQEGDDYDDSADRDGIYLRRVFGCHTTGGRTSLLTAAGTAASRGHVVTSSTVAATAPLGAQLPSRARNRAGLGPRAPSGV
jgi:hypothetical protein